ncbi:response regulator transcription factor [Candidatus Acetothermia bacterium]|nr:response regulator transcription factor [Candidatus Acetothermia bacterium]MBI3644232.1 response regulator transcription factor [Candidatus Acetothermia bacterium]
MTAKILVVDDEMEIVDLVRSYLNQAGFRVVAAYDGEDALIQFKLENPDLIILDLMLPKLDGFDVARKIRQQSNVPILMLTARIHGEDRVAGLELGADDYVPKPFNPRELVARARAILRRIHDRPQPRKVEVNGLNIDLEAIEARWQGKLMDLTPMEFQLLTTLASEPGRAFSREQLLEALTGTAYASTARAVDTHIKNLRKKMGDDSRSPHWILTVPGIGYKFVRPEA